VQRAAQLRDFKHLICLASSRNEQDTAFALFKELKQWGQPKDDKEERWVKKIKIDREVFVAIFKLAIRNVDVPLALEMMKEMKSRQHMELPLYHAFLDMCVKNKLVEVGVVVFREMEEAAVKMNKQTLSLKERLLAAK